MAWTPETTRPTVVSTDLVGRQYDAALDGEPLIVDWAGSGQVEGLGHPEAAGYTQNSAEIGIEQQSTSGDIAENKLDRNTFWRSMRDFRGGLGQNRFDVPKISNEAAYHESSGVDHRVAGQLKLRRASTTPTLTTPAHATQPALDVGTSGVWYLNTNAGGGQFRVTYNTFSAETTKTAGAVLSAYELCVAPGDVVYISAGTEVYTCTVAAAISQWATTAGFDHKKMIAAKRAVYSIGIRSGAAPAAIWSLNEIPTTGTAPVTVTEKAQLAPGLTGACLCEAGPLILVGANPLGDYHLSTTNDSAGAGVLYSYDGTAMIVAATLAPGENIYAIASALGGSVVLLFVKRRDPTSGAIRTVIYRTSVAGTQLTPLQLAFEYPPEYTVNLGYSKTISIATQVYFPAPGRTSGAGYGVDAYDVIEGTVHHDLPLSLGTGKTAASLTNFQGQLVAFGDNSGPTMTLFRESSTTYQTSGTITTSAIDLNVDAAKTWVEVQASCLPLTVGQKIEVSWSADQPGTEDFTLLGTLQPGQSNASFPLGVQSVRLRLRATLYSGATNTTTPTLTKLGVGAQMARLPKLDHTIKIQAYPSQEDLGGITMPAAGDNYLQRVSQRLEDLRVSGRSAWFQSPLSRFDGHAHRVKVGEVARRVTNNPGQGFGGTIAVALHNTDPDRRNLLPLAWASYASMPVAIATVGDIYEAVSSATLAYTTSTSWVAGAAKQLVQVTVAADGRGVRFPSPRLTVPIDPIKYKGLLFSAGCLVRPSVDAMILQLTLEWYDASDVLISSTAAPATTFGTGSANTWLPLTPVEGQSFDAYTSVLYPVVKILRVAGSASGAFLVDAAQIEQASISTRFQLPPATY